MPPKSTNPTLFDAQCDEAAVGRSVPKHSGRPQLILIVDYDRNTRRGSADLLANTVDEILSATPETGGTNHLAHAEPTGPAWRQEHFSGETEPFPSSAPAH